MINASDILCVNRKKIDDPLKHPHRETRTPIYNFAKGVNGVTLSWDEAQSYHDNTVVLYGARSVKAVDHCWNHNTKFFYIDNCYLGHIENNKNWHRVIQNHVHDIRPIIERPRDRLEQISEYMDWVFKKEPQKVTFGINTKPFAPGRSILLAPPSVKSFKLWDIDQDNWIAQTVAEIKKYTDRPIRIRLKRPRDERLKTNTMEQDLKECHCLVTYNSVAAVEALMHGKPAITLGPNAAQHLCYNDLAKIENPYIPSNDEREAWMRHLSYSQFTTEEMANGYAWSILNG